MGDISKMRIFNSSYIGAFSIATDSFVLVGAGITRGERSIIEECTEAKVIESTVDGSSLIGIYAIANSNGIMLPETASKEEVKKLKSELHGVEIRLLGTNLNALRNNILLNDHIAFVNPEYSYREIEEIEEVFNVKAVKIHIGNYGTVGANNIITNKGIVVNNSATDSDISIIKKYVNSMSQSTANLGSSSIGLCVIANSQGMVAGDQTTGFELARIAEGLDL
jgi:translation initiation factor 6